MSFDSTDPHRAQIFLHHGYALGLGGFIERRERKFVLPSIGSAALSIAGAEAVSTARSQ